LQKNANRKIMKFVRTAPNEKGFFETYARLRQSINLSGYAAQVVSALTELGGIFAAAYATLLPVLPALAFYFAAVIAVIGTAVLELGLRVTAPQAVDAVLYKRWQGLHRAMSVAVLLLAVVLIAASTTLSFSNSKRLVAEYAPPAEQLSTAEADSIRAKDVSAALTVYRADSAQIAAQIAQQATAATAAAEGKVKAARRELANVLNREARTGNSYATAKDAARQRIADLEAEQAAQVAALTASSTAEQTAAKERYRAAVAKADNAHGLAVSEVRAANGEAKGDRAATVSAYGGGLAWFTIVCMIVFLASVTLDRIHAKGSGISEKVELTQYDLSPSKWAEAWAAFTERIEYEARSRIAAFAERTPPPPLPLGQAPIYDPAALADLKLAELADDDDDDGKVIQLNRKRRLIGFRQDAEGGTEGHENTDAGGHETATNSRAIKGTRSLAYEDADLRSLKQRLKDYKKRLGKYQQKAIVEARKRPSRQATKRTLDAIENNAQWVKQYTALVQQAEAAAKSKQA
jgi:hypothetical protein